MVLVRCARSSSPRRRGNGADAVFSGALWIEIQGSRALGVSSPWRRHGRVVCKREVDGSMVVN
jgi:hypothetical protein